MNRGSCRVRCGFPTCLRLLARVYVSPHEQIMFHWSDTFYTCENTRNNTGDRLKCNTSYFITRAVPVLGVTNC